jgi:UDP-N-acetyl-2-amino-2-deoxyglucuronate dehydrogenase
MLGFCIVGAGFISGVHAQALSEIPEAKISVVCDNTEKAALALAEKAGAAAETDYRRAVERDDVDIVCVCTPSGTHADIAVAAAQAGKHLVVEKPLDITLERVDRIIQAARTAGVKLACIFPYRFMRGAALAKRALDQGRLGRLVLADAFIKWYRPQEYYDSSNWKGTWALDGGGALMNQGIHNIDLLTYLAGPVHGVVARTATLAHQMETEDTAVALLTYDNGALGAIEGSTASWPGSSGRVELHGDRGSIALEDGRIVTWKVADASPEEKAEVLGETNLGSGASSISGFSHEMHRRQLADMVDAILHDRAPVIAGSEGRRSVAVITAIYESSRRGGWITPD